MEIIIDRVQKKYGSHIALNTITMRIGEGMFGLLGPNGAGKTTLLRILATLLLPTHGRVVMGSYDFSSTAQRKQVRAHLGYLPQELGFYPDLTGREFLDYIGLLKRLYDRSTRRQQIDALFDVTSLASSADRKIKTYSGGMKRRLGIAQALLGDPHILIVDEPTAGLDPEERIRLRTLLTRLARERIVILSTHVVEDISQTCDQVAVLNKGLLAFQGPIQQLIQAASGHTWQFLAPESYLLPDHLRVISALPQPNGVMYRVVGPRPDDSLLQSSIQSVEPTLEDGYVWLRREERRAMFAS